MKKYVNNSFVNKSPLEYKNGTEAVTSLPVTLYTDGQPVSSYTIKGNTSTSGTPSPSNPITINGVGDKTANLFDYNGDKTEFSRFLYKYVITGLTPNAQYICSSNFIADRNKGASIYFNGTSSITNGVSEGYNVISTADENGEVYLLIRHTISDDTNLPVYDDLINGTIWIMLNAGSTAQSYEPFGYKISISSNQTALTPVYLTEQLMKIGDTVDSLASSGTVTRNIKKLVFDGTEEWQEYTGTNAKRYNTSPAISDGVPLSAIICSHFSFGGYTATDGHAGEITGTGSTSAFRMFFWSDITTISAWKAYLAAQYSAGTPVTVYYVLATAETESVTAPSITTTGGEVSIDVDTTVKPSEMSLTYHGWHSHEPLKRENGSWS